MVINKIGESRVEKWERTKLGGEKEVRTELLDSAGNKISETYQIQMGGDKVTLQDDDAALIQHSDGSISLFKNIDGALKFQQRVVLSPSGHLESEIQEEEESRLEHDMALLESARHMFLNAKEEREEFSKVKEELV